MQSLTPCAKSPNCVSSQADPADPVHWIEPLRFSDSAETAWRRLRDVLGAEPRTKILTVTDHHLHAEATTRMLRFVDDLEFLLEPEANVIHVRSASRIGYSDFGTNRRRVERLRRAFDAAK